MNEHTTGEPIVVEMPAIPMHPLEKEGMKLLGKLTHLAFAGDVKGARSLVHLATAYARAVQMAQVRQKGKRAIHRIAKDMTEFPVLLSEHPLIIGAAHAKRAWDALPLGENLGKLIGDKKDLLAREISDMRLEFEQIRTEGPKGYRSTLSKINRGGTDALISRIHNLPDFCPKTVGKWAKLMTKALELEGFPSSPDGQKGWLYTVADLEYQRTVRRIRERKQIANIVAEMKTLPAADRAADRYEELFAPYDPSVRIDGEITNRKIRLRKRYDEYVATPDEERDQINSKDIFNGVKAVIEDRLRRMAK